jgi:hypothetical protein
MGFNKRFLNKEIILNTPEHDMNALFNSDVFIFLDEWSSKFYKYYIQGHSKLDIINLIVN